MMFPGVRAAELFEGFAYLYMHNDEVVRIGSDGRNPQMEILTKGQIIEFKNKRYDADPWRTA